MAGGVHTALGRSYSPGETGFRFPRDLQSCPGCGTNGGVVSGDVLTHPFGWALIGIEGGGPLGQMLRLAAELLELPDAPVEVGGAARSRSVAWAQGAWPLSRKVSE
jgi:hypothetical protein